MPLFRLQKKLYRKMFRKNVIMTLCECVFVNHIESNKSFRYEARCDKDTENPVTI